MIQNSIEKWAQESFYESERANIFLENIDFYTLQNLLDELDLENTTWNELELNVEAVKTYDAEGNSDYEGVLTLNTLGKTTRDVLDLAFCFQVLQYKKEEELYS